MKFTLKRTLLAAVMGIAAVVTPLSLTAALTGTSGISGTVAGATGTQTSPDQIVYGQTTGTPATFYEYVPGNDSATTTQTVTAQNGKCGQPTVSDPNGPILSITAKLYASSPNANYYANASSPGTVGTSGLATGVCNISPNWSIENKSGQGAEALDFSPGSDTTVIGTNRVFSDAQIPIQRKDSGVAQPGATVQLVEFDSSGNQLASQTCTISGGQGTQITADTNGPGTGGNCSGTTASSFATVEVRNLTTSTSLSVVGTTTFTLASQVCGGGSIYSVPSPGAPVATLTLNEASSVCKSYSSFTSTTTQNAGTQVELDATGFTDLHFTMQMTWPVQPYCTPDGVNPGTTACPPDTVTYSDPVTGQNITAEDQLYCTSAMPNTTVPGQQICTVNKAYNYNVNYNNTGEGTQITETYSALADMLIKH